MKKTKLYVVTALLLVALIVGTLLVGIGAGTINKDKKFMASAETRDAIVDTVINNEGTRKYVLWFNVDGENYYIDYDYNWDNGDYVGRDVKVYFTKDAPENIFIKTAEVYTSILYIGICLMVVSVALLLIIYIPIFKDKYVLKNGKSDLVMINEIVDVIGGQKIICDSSKIRGKTAVGFKSKRVGQKVPKELLHSAVTVYYLPKHKNIYFVDTSTIKFKGDEK